MKFPPRLHLLWRRFRANHSASFYLSHSQFGEDMVLRALTRDRRFGFYVDVGAHHPFYYSNTFHFYSKGWSGINVDAVPGSMKPFLELRPRDINVEACVGRANRWVEFSIFEEQALNTMDSEVASKLIQQNRARLLRKQKLKTQSLAQILENHLPRGQTIDFLSIDVEGADLEVLESNNWDTFRPEFIVVESHGTDLHKIHEVPVAGFLAARQYTPVASTGPSLIFSRC
jgi:FkbM family methyltransferase